MKRAVLAAWLLVCGSSFAQQPVIKGADLELLEAVREIAGNLAELRGQPFARSPIAVRAPQPVQQVAAEIHAYNVLSRERLAGRGRAWSDLGLGLEDSPRRLFLLLAADVEGVALDRQNSRLLVDPAILTGSGFEPGEAEEASTLLMVTGVGADEPLVAHALMHLQQLERRGDDPLADTTDALLARSALAEGEANLVALRLLFDGMELADEVLRTPLDPGDYLDGALVPAGIEQPSATETALLSFVYDEGFAKLAALYRGGGWASVDAALRGTATTRGVLHPDLAGSPVSRFPSPQPPAEGFRLVDEDSLGEHAVFVLLSLSTGKDNLALLAADGWDGDRLYRWESDDLGEAVTEWRTRWRTAEDARDFAYAMQRSLDVHRPTVERSHRLETVEREVRLTIGPPSTAEAARIPAPEPTGEANHEPVR